MVTAAFAVIPRCSLFRCMPIGQLRNLTCPTGWGHHRDPVVHDAAVVGSRAHIARLSEAALTNSEMSTAIRYVITPAGVPRYTLALEGLR